MKEKVEMILKHDITCFINRLVVNDGHTTLSACNNVLPIDFILFIKRKNIPPKDVIIYYQYFYQVSTIVFLGS